MAASCLGFIFLCMAMLQVSASSQTSNSTSLTFDEAFSKVFGYQTWCSLKNKALVSKSLSMNTLVVASNHKNLISNLFLVLPSNSLQTITRGTFYASNSETLASFPDELDFEFLGNANDATWVLQTNVYGNGSVSRERQERYNLSWFDPIDDFHRYSILWTRNWTVFYVDDSAIRMVKRVDAMGGDYPSKSMNLYVTIWDGSNWATERGKCKADYTYGPFSAQCSDFVIDGCSMDLIQQQPNYNNVSSFITNFNDSMREEIQKMRAFRTKYMTYSYCHRPSA